jgi:hypothetical protein
MEAAMSARRAWDVRTTHHDADTFSVEPLTERVHERGQRRRPGRLDHELGRAERETHGVADLLVAHQYHLVYETPVERVRVRLATRCAERIGDGAHGVDRLR